VSSRRLQIRMPPKTLVSMVVGTQHSSTRMWAQGNKGLLAGLHRCMEEAFHKLRMEVVVGRTREVTA